MKMLRNVEKMNETWKWKISEQNEDAKNRKWKHDKIIKKMQKDAAIILALDSLPSHMLNLLCMHVWIWFFHWMHVVILGSAIHILCASTSRNEHRHSYSRAQWESWNSKSTFAKELKLPFLRSYKVCARSLNLWHFCLV